MTSNQKPEDNAEPAPKYAAEAVVWVAAVSLAWLVTFTLSLLQHAEHAADRMPLVDRLLHFLHMGS